VATIAQPSLVKYFQTEIEKSKIKSSKSDHQNDEEQLLKEVIKLSEEEYKKEKERKKEIERMEKSLALSSKEESER
jgi:protein subunit release factor B